MADSMKLERPELAAMVILMLRGPQTVGEIRTRSNRIFDFPSLENVETTLNALIARSLVARLPRQTGQKDVRYAHLLSGEVSSATAAAAPSDTERIAKLEEVADQLRKEMDELRNQLQQFRKQFE